MYDKTPVSHDGILFEYVVSDFTIAACGAY